MIPCPVYNCGSENVIRIAKHHLKYLCLDCRQEFFDYVDLAEWYDDDYEQKADEYAGAN